MPLTEKTISLVLPFYNEKDNASSVVAEAHAALAAISPAYEIVAVDDGSRDGTGAILERLAISDRRVKPVSNPVNTGYGGALRAGIAAAGGEWIFLCDGDAQFRLSDLAALAAELPSFPVVLGYRGRRMDPWHRKLNSGIYNLAARLLFGLRVKDLNCAMKGFHAANLKKVRFRTTGLVASLDILVQALAGGVPYKELEVPHFPRTLGTPTGADPWAVLRAVKELVLLRAAEFRRGPR